MSDPKAVRPPLHHPAPPNPLFLRDEELVRGLDLLACAMHDLQAGQATLLARHELGFNHQRLMHLVARRPGVTMAKLLTLVPLTKQSVSRLLKELTARGLLSQAPNRQDRRERLLTLTERGRRLEEELTSAQCRRIAAAYRAAGAEAVAGHHQVLAGLIDERARRYLDGLN